MSLSKSSFKKFVGAAAVAVVSCGVVLMSVGCAAKPRIALQIDRPPTFNVTGISSIAVMPFDYQIYIKSEAEKAGEAMGGAMFGSQTTFLQADESAYRGAAQHATAMTINNIQALNLFSIVDRQQADAVLVGTITKIEGTDKQNSSPMPPFSRTVLVEFNYSLLRPDGSVIGGPIRKRGSLTSNASERGDLQRITELLTESINHALRTLYRDFTPHTITENRTFAKDNSSPAVKAAMKNALDLVNAGNHREALQAYLAIYDEHKSAAAAINASILYEMFSETQTAADLMQRAVNETGDAQAQTTLARLNKILEDQATLASDYGSDDSEESAVGSDDATTSELQEESESQPSAEEHVEEQSTQIEQQQQIQAAPQAQPQAVQNPAQQRYQQQIDLLTRQLVACSGDQCALLLFQLGGIYYATAIQSGGQDFSMAKQTYQQLLNEHPNSPYAPQARQVLTQIETMENQRR